MEKLDLQKYIRKQMKEKVDEKNPQYYLLHASFHFYVESTSGKSRSDYFQESDLGIPLKHINGFLRNLFPRSTIVDKTYFFLNPKIFPTFED